MRQEPLFFGAEYWFNWNLQVAMNSNIMRKMQGQYN